MSIISGSIEEELAGQRSEDVQRRHDARSIPTKELALSNHHRVLGLDYGVGFLLQTL